MRDNEGPPPAELTTPLNWTDDEETRRRKFVRYSAAIRHVILDNPDKSGIPLHLAIGEASAMAPTLRDKSLWLRAVRNYFDEKGELIRVCKATGEGLKVVQADGWCKAHCTRLECRIQ